MLTTSSLPRPAPKSVTLDRPLQVALDGTSAITITQMQQNYLIIDNLFEDAGVAQTFGTALNHVIAGNRSVRTAGFFIYALVYEHFQPSWQVQLLDNRIIEGNTYEGGPDRTIHFGEAAVAIKAVRPPDMQATPPLVRAAIVRGNHLDEDAHIEVTGVQPAHPGVRDVVIENNVIGAARMGVYVDRGTQWWIDRRNVVKTVLK